MENFALPLHAVTASILFLQILVDTIFFMIHIKDMLIQHWMSWTAVSVKNSPMRSTTNAPWDIRDLCWKSITMAKHSPSPSTKPVNRATNRSPRTITRSPSPKRSCHHLQRIRPDPSDFFRRTCNHHPDAFRERNHHRKPRLHKPGDTFVRLRRKLFLIFEIFSWISSGRR